MTSWPCMLGGILVVLEATAQPPIAIMDMGPARSSKSLVELKESSVFFEIRAGLIFLEATLNGVQGSYVVDTGAPGLVINRKPEKTGELSGRGVTGSMEVEEVIVEQFSIGAARFQKLKAYKIDLGYLEDRLQCEIDGLIGYDVLKEMETVLDYPGRVITFLPLNGPVTLEDKRAGYVGFSLVNHIPVIDAQLGKREIRLGLDTGAGANVLNTFLGKPYQNKQAAQGKVRGADRNLRRSAMVQAPVVIEGYEENGKALDYWLMDLSQIRNDLDYSIDGLLGFPFLKQGKWSIDYVAQRIYFWN